MTTKNATAVPPTQTSEAGERFWWMSPQGDMHPHTHSTAPSITAYSTMSTFGKNVDTIDNANVHAHVYAIFMDSLCQNTVDAVLVILVLTNLFGSVIVIANDLPSSSITSATHSVARYHRFTDAASALGMKRLDAILRSVLYAHFSESLTRLGEIPRFVRDNKYIDLENRALFLTCLTGSSWLAVRLDALGSVPVFVIGIFTAVGLAGTSPAEVGLILTYKSQLLCSLPLTTCTPSSELSIMPAGRGDLVPGEAAHESTPRITEWPAQGEIEFKNVTMTYRPGLPTVLHDISLQIKPSEKIGMVGRTGAWLTDLCSNIAIIPQEPIPFSGAFFNPVRCATKGFSADEMQALANAPEDARSDDGEVEIDSGDEYN
ncbi:hypothetical protein B0H16DRAFT_1719593 [Mycena metata]|uniref:ABC transmembrane type-1 domain-containing protein n=1 Tax=Mycena metata TaxID=1033252 RepID=A0AAD7JDF5_9AGAR|nr:hypothetical protein B0H16DRAFT_1719593 [Mycena metata]